MGEPDAAGAYNVWTSYGYDVAGRLRTVSMNGGLQTRTFNYNAQNQLTSEVHPESGTTSYTYNADGMLLTRTDAKNQTFNFEYDSFHRLAREYLSSGGYEKRFYYDTYAADPGANIYGRLAAIEWSPPAAAMTGGTQLNEYKHVFGYLNWGAVTRSKLSVTSTFTSSSGSWWSETQVLEATFNWTMQEEMSTIVYPDGRSLYYKFDAAGRANGLHQNAAAGFADMDLVTGATFTKAGKLATMDFTRDPFVVIFPAARRESRSYNDLLQLTNIWVGSPDGTQKKMDFSYNYAAGANNGKISAEVNNLTGGATVAYTFDELSRLKTAVSTTGGSTNWGLSFGYDAYGNRTAQTVTAGSAPQSSFTFDNNNRMNGYSYDANGNQLTTTDAATLTYDQDNRVASWSKAGNTEKYQYHPAGWRVWKATNGTTWGTFYLYGPHNEMLAEMPTISAPISLVHFGGRLLYTSEGAVYRDRMGSTRAVESNGGVVTSRNFYPFGEEIAPTANNRKKFADTYRDATTGLDYAINRYYANNTARFLSPDPLGLKKIDRCHHLTSSGSLFISQPSLSQLNPANPQSFNRYTYTENDPVNYRDPSGLIRDQEETDPPCGGGGGDPPPQIPRLPGQGDCLVEESPPAAVVLTASQALNDDPIPPLSALVRGVHSGSGQITRVGSKVVLDRAEGAPKGTVTLIGDPQKSPFQPNRQLLQRYTVEWPDSNAPGYLGTVVIGAEFECDFDSPTVYLEWRIPIYAVRRSSPGGPRD